MILARSIHEANAITHAGTFHADEVFATVILDLVRDASGDTELVLYRTGVVPARLDDRIVVYDIGGGEFDHHQRGGNGARPNGVPYAACGLIWRKFGHILCRNSTNPRLMWRMIDREIIQPIDAVDCGAMPRTDYIAQPCTISTIISAFDDNWDEPIGSNDCFMEAYKFAHTVFCRIAEKAYSKTSAYAKVYECLNKATDGIMVMDKHLPWTDPILHPEPEMAEKAASLKFIVYPARRDRGGYQWRGIPDRAGDFGLRKNAPRAWWGLRGEELEAVTGIKGAIFCHPNGFIGGADSLEGTIAMAKAALAAT